MTWRGVAATKPHAHEHAHNDCYFKWTANAGFIWRILLLRVNPSLGWLLPKLPPHLSPTLAPRGHRPTLLSPKHGPDKDSDAHLGPGWLAEMEPPGDVDGDGAEVMKE